MSESRFELPIDIGIEKEKIENRIIDKRCYNMKNEYCLNENTIEFNSTSIIGNYNPLIQLIGSNGIDKPVAQVELDILFLQL